MNKLPEISRDVDQMIAETNMMDALALGMYQRLLWQSWRETPPCSLPDDDAYLALVARVSVSEFMERKHAVMFPFTLGADKRWHHPKMKVFFDKARERAKAYQSNARRRWEQSRTSEPGDNSNTDTTAMQRHSNGSKTVDQRECSPLSLDSNNRESGGSVRGAAMQRHQTVSIEEIISIWEAVFGEMMNIATQEKLAYKTQSAPIRDASVWREALDAWMLNGYRSRNLDGQLDYYRQRQERADKEAAKREKAKVIPITVNQTPGLCNTCFGNLTVPYKDPETNLVKGRKPCPKCAVQQKTA